MKIILSFFLLTSMLFGHKLYILADDDGKNLHVKSYFTKNSTCKECEVKVYQAKKLLDSGKTDKNGNATFKLKAKDIEIEVTASMGHKNRIIYSSENEIATEKENITAKKIFMALMALGGIFYLIRLIKK